MVLLLLFCVYQKYDYVDLSVYESETITVEIKGEVENPNVYTLAYHSTVSDLIDAAGGLSQNGDTSTINLSQVLSNEDVVVIPAANEEEETLVSINSADLEELMTLNGIGEATAQKIIDYREENGSFQTLEEIMNVSGIKEKLYAKIKDYICL